jgi:hypothetical protein
MKYLLICLLSLSACGPYVVEHTGEITVKVTLDELATYFETKCAVDNSSPEDITTCIGESIIEFKNILGIKDSL